MIKAWINMWKNVFDYQGRVSRREYWKSLLMNLIAMYVLIIPYSLLFLLLQSFGQAIVLPLSVAYVLIMNLPVISLYFRRANDIGWKKSTAIFTAVAAPCIIGILAGIMPANMQATRTSSRIGKLFALSFGLYFYGMVLSICLFGTPDALSFLPIAGLLLGTGTLIYIWWVAKFKKKDEE